MPYAVSNENLVRMTRFEISVYENKEAIKNTDDNLKLNNPAEFLKLVEKSEPGSYDVKLNIEEMTPGIIGQEYIYTEGENSTNLSLWGYDAEKNVILWRTRLKTS